MDQGGSIENGRAEGVPFAGCFRTDDKAYLYDVNKNSIVRIPDEVYSELVRLLESGGSLSCSENQSLPNDPVISGLLEQGFLSPVRAGRVALGYDAEVFRGLIDEEIQQCILELTQLCNLNCRYCNYSPLHKGRRDHSPRRMSWPTAEAAIDYFLSHTTLAKLRSLSFYGGEPLLEWPLLRRCVEYARSAADSDNLKISFTTNATLVTDEVARFCVSHGIHVLISLDGSAEMHDAKRVFRKDGTGSHAATLAGLNRLVEAFGDEFSQYISINAVFGPWSDVGKMAQFFTHQAPEKVQRLKVRLSAASLSNTTRRMLSDPTDPIGDRSIDCLRLKWFRVLAGEEEVDAAELELLRGLFQELYHRFYHRKLTPLGETLPLKGMCLPGIRRMFVDAEGRILPCERVSEHDANCLGHIHNGGIDPEKCVELCRRMEDWFSKRCPDCIYCRICTGCLNQFTDEDGVMSDVRMERFCRQRFRECGEFLVSWARAIEANPTCFDYLEGIELV